MCIFILAIMAILAFYLAGQINNTYLVEKTDGISFNLASDWQILVELWPAMAFMFLAGVLFMLLALKLVGKRK